MDVLNRAVEPALQTIGTLDLIIPEELELDNGLKVYVFNSGEQEVIKMDLIFNAGRWFETSRYVAAATASLITEETTNLSAEELSERIDIYGASIKCRSGFDTSTLYLSGMTKTLDKVIPLLEDMISNASFTDKELNLYIQTDRGLLSLLRIAHSI
ncbi:MAG: insulinase family protein [Bacteroidetes bacterium]|nr:insulinase family protein [Bacteroidota bacterium]